MAINDPIADMLIRIRNAANARSSHVSIPYSRIKESIGHLLVGEGFFRGMEVAGEGPRKAIVVEIKYATDGKPVFHELKRASKLGRRVYIGADEIKPIKKGAGVSIISTSKGLMKDMDAKRQGVGGEVLFTIW